MKSVQPAQPRDPLGAGAEHQMIGVAEDDVGAGRAHVGRLHRLHRRRGADRHEGRRADLAAPHRDRAGAGAAVGGGDGEGEARGRPCVATARLQAVGFTIALVTRERKLPGLALLGLAEFVMDLGRDDAEAGAS